MARSKHIDDILGAWPYDPSSIKVRMCKGADGRQVLQMRVDMGLLQMEVEGRPDGERPHGCDTYFDYLLSRVIHEGDELTLTDDDCLEIDRELVQFYHRRVCWLRLEEYREVAKDVDHTLSLMDFCERHATDENWIMAHEQYRPFVMFHKIQATALAELEEKGPEVAVQSITHGLQWIRELFESHELDERFEDDELVQRLVQMRETLREAYSVGRTLRERLDDAVASERYELAAQLRDELRRRERTRQ